MSDAGDTLTNRQLDEYRILALLGQGGMARIYLGEDVRLKRYVAIKVIDRPFREEPAYIDRFEREAQAIARLEHPHIVRLYRYGETDRLLYMAMQYVEGADLGTILDSYRHEGLFMPPQEALAIVRDVGAALDYAHRKEIIHRDVKPSNILLDRAGQAYLTDFGLALLTTTGTIGETFGTPQYISPEQVTSSAEVGPHSDLYSLGVVLYEMFTGALPFTGQRPLEIALQRLNQPPPDPRQQRPDIDPAVAAVIRKAMAREPGERFQNGAALSRALEEALAGRPSTTVISPTRSLSERVTEVYDAQGRSPAAMTRARPATMPTTPARPAALPAATAQPATAVESAAAAQPIVAAQPPPTDQAPSAPPAQPERHNMRILWGASILLLLCLVGALALLSNWGTQPEDELAMPLVTGEATGASDATRPVATPTAATPTPREPSPTAPPAAVAPDEAITVVTRGEDSLFLVNATGSDLRLAGLQLGEGENAVRGVEWEIVSLAPGECVTVWKQQGNPDAPNVDCAAVGARVTRHSRDIFWKQSFPIYYRETQIAVCDGECSFTLP
ncbi:MAG: serine/threonine-protein kinase [Anaerolineae bacterium]|nr:serine/threonine-protein kinase [Anaerolineae bacterium]